ncbi:MAG: NfeD family protein [Brachymonas sp.]|nr:NfeD family protein [Brachymonas sp.]
MEASTLWWIAAAVLVIAEMLTSTVYLLTLAAGLAAGAIAAHMGLALNLQLVVAALVGAAATLAWHFSHASKSRASNVHADANTDVHQDIGAQVQVDAWNTDGTAQVRYRGSQWSVIAAKGVGEMQPGLHRVKEVSGSRLIVERI